MKLVEQLALPPVRIEMHQPNVKSRVWKAASAMLVLYLVETNVFR